MLYHLHLCVRMYDKNFNMVHKNMVTCVTTLQRVRVYTARTRVRSTYCDVTNWHMRTHTRAPYEKYVRTRVPNWYLYIDQLLSPTRVKLGCERLQDDSTKEKRIQIALSPLQDPREKTQNG